MSTLLSAINSLLSSTPSRASQDGVNGIQRPLREQDHAQISRYAPVTPTNTFTSAVNSIVNVPRSMQPAVSEAASIAVGLAANKFGPSKAYGAIQMVDVASKVFQGNVSTSSFVTLQRSLSVLAPKAGVALAKVGQIVNTVSAVVNSQLGQAAIGALSKFGTTNLPAAEYAQYTQDLQQGVAAGVSNLFGGGEPAVTVNAIAPPGPIASVPLDDPTGAVSSSAVTAPSDVQYVDGFATESAYSAQQSMEVSDNKKVFLRSAITFNSSDIVRFDGQPKISCTDKADYDIFNPVHSPIGFASYKSSPLRTLSISDIKLISTNPEEATLNIRQLTLMRSWARPYFGKTGETTSAPTGAPPDILYLFAYASDQPKQSGSAFYRFPCVLTDLSYEYPNDVDYVAALDGTPFPIIMTVSLTLLETRSPREVEQFDLIAYKQGSMVGW